MTEEVVDGSGSTPPPPRRVWLWATLAGLIPILIVTALLHLYAATIWLPEKPWGDEVHYLQVGVAEARLGETSLLPGTFRFGNRPRVITRVYARFAAEGLRGDDLVHAIIVFNIAVMLALAVLVYAQAFLLGMRPASALAAVGALVACPWYAFHVQALWPEILHAFFFAGATALLLLYIRERRTWILIPAGLVMGCGLMVKQALVPFLPVLFLQLGWLSLATWPRGARLGREPLLRSVLPIFVLIASIFVVVGPQLARNASDGHGLHLAANRWWNLELGLTMPPSDMKLTGSERWDRTIGVNLRYINSARKEEKRENFARARTLEALAENGIARTAWWQLQKLWRVFATDPSAFDESLGFRERWGEEAPAALRALQIPARLYWYVYIVVGFVGLATTWRKSPGWLLLASFVVVYLASLAAVPLKVRFAMPLVPVLALFVGAALERIISAAERRASHGDAREGVPK